MWHMRLREAQVKPKACRYQEKRMSVGKLAQDVLRLISYDIILSGYFKQLISTKNEGEQVAFVRKGYLSFCNDHHNLLCQSRSFRLKRS